METRICQYTGVEFQGTKRSKNHPLVSQLLQDAHRDRNPQAYSIAKESLVEAKDLGFTDINDFISYAKAAITGSKEQYMAEMNRRREEQRQRDQARKEREKLNAKLRENGYVWRKTYANSDEYEDDDPTLWLLYSEDGREVSVEQALDEIERGVEIVIAEVEAKEQQMISEAVEAKAINDKAKAEYNQAKDTATNGLVETTSFGYSNLQTTYERKFNNAIERVLTGEIRGVRCAVIYEYYGGHDYTENVSYYCENPDELGLSEVRHTDDDEFFSRFWG